MNTCCIHRTNVTFLLDQNLSRKLIAPLSRVWPGCNHVYDLALSQASDRAIWEDAKNKALCILTKDSDFLHLALLYGAPPKVIIIRAGNVSTSDIEHMLLAHQKEIDDFLASMVESLLVIP